jgi:hypothetical protein
MSKRKESFCEKLRFHRLAGSGSHGLIYMRKKESYLWEKLHHRWLG